MMTFFAMINKIGKKSNRMKTIIMIDAITIDNIVLLVSTMSQIILIVKSTIDNAMIAHMFTKSCIFIVVHHCQFSKIEPYWYVVYNMTTYNGHHLFAYSSSPFSQWFAYSFDATIGDTEYTFANAEQYMMASKAHLFEDMVTFDEIMKTSDPKKMKALGRKISGFNQEVWDQ